jgi:hypothetical protein
LRPLPLVLGQCLSGRCCGSGLWCYESEPNGVFNAKRS